MFACDLGTNLAIGSEPVSGPERIVEHEIQFELARRVLMITLDHVEAHGLTVFDDPHEDRPEFLELVYVIAIRLGYAAIRFAVVTALQPHHFWLGAAAKLQPVPILKFLVNDA